jgi:hypothetical protein
MAGVIRGLPPGTGIVGKSPTEVEAEQLRRDRDDLAFWLDVAWRALNGGDGSSPGDRKMDLVAMREVLNRVKGPGWSWVDDGRPVGEERVKGR